MIRARRLARYAISSFTSPTHKPPQQAAARRTKKRPGFRQGALKVRRFL